MQQVWRGPLTSTQSQCSTKPAGEATPLGRSTLRPQVGHDPRRLLNSALRCASCANADRLREPLIAGLICRPVIRREFGASIALTGRLRSAVRTPRRLRRHNMDTRAAVGAECDIASQMTLAGVTEPPWLMPTSDEQRDGSQQIREHATMGSCASRVAVYRIVAAP